MNRPEVGDTDAIATAVNITSYNRNTTSIFLVSLWARNLVISCSTFNLHMDSIRLLTVDR
ncbi:hypothetical protein H6G27_18140 [Nostoc linckia FACHB-104]|nr:hypothetical protein [Nostoc linckia FACHB-104]